jgi:hypothetical protein
MNWYHWLRGVWDEVWFAKPRDTPPQYIDPVQFSELTIVYTVPLDFAPEVCGYECGGERFFFRTFEPWSPKSRKARDDWDDARLRKAFVQALYESNLGGASEEE